MGGGGDLGGGEAACTITAVGGGGDGAGAATSMTGLTGGGGDGLGGGGGDGQGAKKPCAGFEAAQPTNRMECI